MKSSPGYCPRRVSSYFKGEGPSRISKIRKKQKEPLELKYLCEKLDILVIRRPKMGITVWLQPWNKIFWMYAANPANESGLVSGWMRGSLRSIPVLKLESMRKHVLVALLWHNTFFFFFGKRCYELLHVLSKKSEIHGESDFCFENVPKIYPKNI